MLPEEQAENSRYFYELASARFGWSWDVLKKVQAFHFKGGQGAKTGTGGHLPGAQGRRPDRRGARPARGHAGGLAADASPTGTASTTSATSPTRCASASGGIPIGFKLSAQHIEDDIDAALAIGVDYVILDGRGGGTGAAPLLFRDNISVPTIPALARARRHLDRRGRRDVTLVVTGGLRHAPDFAKALALGADAVAIANSAIQAIGCLGMRACHTNNCPVGIATQKPHLRARLPVDEAAAPARPLPARDGRADAGAGPRVRAPPPERSSRSTTSPRSTATWPHLTGIAYGGRPCDDASRPSATAEPPCGTRSPSSTSSPTAG